jgi:hypothetical protein
MEQAQILNIRQNQKDSEALRELVRQYMDDRIRRLSNEKHDETVKRHEKYTSVIEWLSTSEGICADHERFCKIRSESVVSGEWILQHEKVQNWREIDPPASSILWINGKPGAGMVEPSTCSLQRLNGDRKNYSLISRY